MTTTHTTSMQGTTRAAAVRSWPLLLLAAPAFVAVWSGWVGLGELTGFGEVRVLPGIVDDLVVNTAITLPIGVETYGAYALKVWLTPDVSARARRFACWSSLGALLLGAAGQVAYHLMEAAAVTVAPWQITAVVACLPVAVLGMGAALAHLVHTDQPQEQPEERPADQPADQPGDRPADRDDDEDQDDDAAPVPAPVPAPRPAGPLSVAGRSTSARAGKRPATRTGGDTAARVARLRQQHPDLSAAEIARRLGVTDRTVRRHLPTPTGSTTPDSTPTTQSTTDRTEDAA